MLNPSKNKIKIHAFWAKMVFTLLKTKAYSETSCLELFDFQTKHVIFSYN